MPEHTKVCRRCAEELPASAFAIARNNRDGLQRYCRACHKAVRTGDAPPARHKFRPQDGRKRCTKCHEWKPLDEAHFTRDTKRTVGFRSTCKACANAALRALEGEARERRNRNDLASYYRHRHKRADRARERARLWYYANPDKRCAYAIANRERINLRSRATHARRKAQKLNAGGRYTVEDVQRIFEAQGGCCYWCEKDLRGKAFHADHYIPLARGGSNDPSNIVVACPRCNQSRQHRMPWEWRPREAQL